MTSRSRQAAYSISFLIHLKRKQVIFIFKSKPVIIAVLSGEVFLHIS